MIYIIVLLVYRLITSKHKNNRTNKGQVQGHNSKEEREPFIIVVSKGSKKTTIFKVSECKSSYSTDACTTEQ